MCPTVEKHVPGDEESGDGRGDDARRRGHPRPRFLAALGMTMQPLVIAPRCFVAALLSEGSRCIGTPIHYQGVGQNDRLGELVRNLHNSRDKAPHALTMSAVDMTNAGAGAGSSFGT